MKKSQVWVLDVFFAFLVFVAVLVIFFKAETNLSEGDEQVFDDILFESRLVTDSLLSTGFPRDWDPTDVSEIGIAGNYRINETKLSNLQSMAYTSTKSKLRTRYDYYLFFESSDGIMRIDSQEGIGKPGVNSTNIVEEASPHNLVSAYRFVVFRSKPAKMVLYLWD